MTSDTCDICKEEMDTNVYMLIDCRIIRDLWNDVCGWISYLGVENSQLTYE